MGQAAIPDSVPPEGVRGLVVDPSIQPGSPPAAASATTTADNPEDADAPLTSRAGLLLFFLVIIAVLASVAAGCGPPPDPAPAEASPASTAPPTTAPPSIAAPPPTTAPPPSALDACADLAAVTAADARAAVEALPEAEAGALDALMAARSARAARLTDETAAAVRAAEDAYYWHAGRVVPATGRRPLVPAPWADLQLRLRDVLWCFAGELPAHCGGQTALDVRSARITEPLTGPEAVGPMAEAAVDYIGCYIDAAARQ